MSKWNINFHWTRDRPMKYLLSILVLFSGLSFSYDFICDEPYTFYPDKNKRHLVKMDGTEVDMYKLSSDNYRLLKYSYNFITTDSKYKWEMDTLGTFKWSLDRETLMLIHWERYSRYQCKVVDWSGFKNALSELTNIVDKTKKKRKI